MARHVQAPVTDTDTDTDALRYTAWPHSHADTDTDRDRDTELDPKKGPDTANKKQLFCSPKQNEQKARCRLGVSVLHTEKESVAETGRASGR